MYHSKAGTMQALTGTYQLTTYIQKDDNGNDINRLSTLHVKAYMVVGNDGHGYYAYQDDNTEFKYDTTLIRYTKDLDNPELYKAIQFTTGVSDTRISYQKPGYGYEPTMGFNDNTKTFNYTIPDDRHPRNGFYPSYYTSVVYTKISDRTDLSTIAREMHKTLAPLPRFETKNLAGILIFHANQPNTSVDPTAINPEYDKYKYYVIDFDDVNETADIYYTLTNSDEPCILNDQPIEVSVVRTTDDYGNISNRLTIKLLNQDYSATISFGGAPRYLNYEIMTQPDEYGTMWNIYSNGFEKYQGEQTVNEVVATQLEIYNNSHN